MNWSWDIRSRDGAMNGLEFARCTTAGGFDRVLVHAAPARMAVEIRTDEGETVARGDLDRDGPYTPMTLLVRDGASLRREDLWPAREHHGLPVLLAGGEAGILHAWRHADDHASWRWSVEFSNHVGRPADWAPPAQDAEIRALVSRWAAAVHAGDLAGVLADHADDIVMFDVPPPDDGVRGIDAYRDLWPPFFEWQRSGASFEIVSLDVTAGDDVAFAHALLRCGTPEDLARNPGQRLRLTIGLRRDGGRWVVTHEHHSFPAP